jgi:ABC-2 type transport system permease protein
LNKILIVAKRDYIESVRTKAFLIGLFIAPILFGSGFIVLALMKSKPDIAERRIALVDRSGAAAATVIATIEQRNQKDLIDPDTGKQGMPRYRIETVAPDMANPDSQRLALSQRVKDKELYGFLEIGANVLHPDSTGEKNPENGVSWYSIAVSQGGNWISGPINDGIRRVRMAQAGVDTARFDDLLGGVSVRTMNLVRRDEKTGAILPAEKRSPAAVAVPIGLVMMLFMISMLSAAPMLNAIAEDKLQRVHEMLLASATPFDLIAGKVLAAVGRSLTSLVLYIGGALFTLNAMAMGGVLPLETIGWFVLYVIAEITMLSALAAALGSACGSPQDAQSLAMILFAPVIIPIMMLSAVIEKPNGALAQAMSFFPPFTPMMMLLRQAMPGGVPAWEPWVAMVGMIAGVAAISWGASRIFRVGILMQGKPPSSAELLKWAVRG